MAFIPTLPMLRSRRQPHTTTHAAPTMAQAPLSRRAALRFAAASLAAVAASALAAKDNGIDIKDLKEDVEELNYEDEVLDAGPDPQEKNLTRIKKKQPTPKFREEETELVQEEEKKYDAMVAKELEDEKRIKAQFSKSK